MSLAKQEFTNAGRSMLGRAQNGETLTVSKIVIGSGVASVPADLWPLTALIHFEMNVTISAKNDYGQGTLLVEGSFRSDSAPHAFQLREVGVMAHIGAEADRLYSLANAFSDAVDTIDPAAPAMQSFKIKLIIDRIPTASLVVQIGPSENVIGQNLGASTVGPGWYKDASGNVLNFKRIVQGAGMDIHDSTDGNSVYVGQKMLTANLNLYVPASHPNCPDPSVGFATIQDAIAYLQPWQIPSDKFAFINVYIGVWRNDGVIAINHPNARQIYLIGWPRQDKTVTAINYVNPTTKNVTVTPDTTGLSTTPGAPGNIVYLAGTGISPSWSGGCAVTAINPATKVVTLSVPNRSTRTYSTNQTSGAMRLSWFPSVLMMNDPNESLHGQFMPQNLQCYYGIAMIMNFTLRNGFHGIALYQSGRIQNVHCQNCWGGISSEVSVVLTGEVILSDCETGLTGSNSIEAAGGGAGLNLYVNGCGQGIAPAQGAGCWICRWNSSVPAITTCHVSHCGYGISAQGAHIWCSKINYETNDYAMAASLMGRIFNWPFASFPANNFIDLYASGMSYIQYHLGGGSTPSTNPPAGPNLTQLNQNSYIYVVND